MPEFAILPETMPLRVQAKPWPRRETFAFVMKVVWQLSEIQNRFFKKSSKGRKSPRRRTLAIFMALGYRSRSITHIPAVLGVPVPRTRVASGIRRVKRIMQTGVEETNPLEDHNGLRQHEADAGNRRALRASDPALEPQDASLHFRRAQRHPYH